MTLLTSTAIETFTTPGTTFVYTMDVLREIDIRVKKTGVAPGLVETELEYFVDFTVDLDTKTVTTDDALLTGEQLHILQGPPREQGYVPTRVPFLPSRFEAALDAITKQAQALREQMSRTLKVDTESAVTPDDDPAAAFVHKRVLLASGWDTYDNVSVDLTWPAGTTTPYDRLLIEFKVGFEVVAGGVIASYRILQSPDGLPLLGSLRSLTDAGVYAEATNGGLGVLLSGTQGEYSGEIEVMLQHKMTSFRVVRELAGAISYAEGAVPLIDPSDEVVGITFYDTTLLPPRGHAFPLADSYIRVWGVPKT